MKINEYKEGDKVEVLMNNPRNNNKDEWRDGEVISKRYIHPQHGPAYPILIVKVIRTYCKATPVYRWLDGNIPVFVDNNLEFYEKGTEEGFLYENTIRLKS